MRSGRTLTVFRRPLPPRKIGDPEKLETPQKIGDTPQKIGDPPEKLETPRKIGDTPLKNWRPPQDQTRHPPWTDTRLWKYYLGQNLVSAGKNAITDTSFNTDMI